MAEAQNKDNIAVAYLLRGADKGWFNDCKNFVQSYNNYNAGVSHSLYVILKGFNNNADLEKAQSLFSSMPHEPVFLDDYSFDIGAYIEWSKTIDENLICMLNTTSEILSPDWLYKLKVNLEVPGVGLVGATGNYERGANPTVFPNLHIRSTGFMIERGLFCELTKNTVIKNKGDAYRFESGENSLTNRILALGKNILVVGKNGRGYSPDFWIQDDLFRQGMQENILIADKQTRNYNELTWVFKKAFSFSSWGGGNINKQNNSLLDDLV